MPASLPMYNLPEMREANARFWVAIRGALEAQGVAAPAELSFQSPPVPASIGADVLFTQTCGYPLQTIYQGQFSLLGRPCYDAPGCSGADHSAFLCVRRDSAFGVLEDLRGGVFALNSRQSNSGFNLPRRLIAPLNREGRFFREVVVTGGHGASLALVARGGADVASVDCLTHAIYAQHQPQVVEALRVLVQTPSSPCIPFVTSCETDDGVQDALRAALLQVAHDPDCASTLRALRISNIVEADAADYRLLMDYEQEAIELGYPDIA